MNTHKCGDSENKFIKFVKQIKEEKRIKLKTENILLIIYVIGTKIVINSYDIEKSRGFLHTMRLSPFIRSSAHRSSANSL